MTDKTQEIKSFQIERAKWLEQNLTKEAAQLCKRNGIDIPQYLNDHVPVVDNWGNWRWHIRNRITTLNELSKLFPEYYGREAELVEWFKSYDLSILPLNLNQPNGVKKFLPRPGMMPA